MRPVSRLTPLLSAVVQSDGTVKEPNPLGEEPRPTGHERYREGVYNQGTYPNNDAADDFEQKKEAWRTAEASRRTWEVAMEWKEDKTGMQSVPQFRHYTPGTSVLGYLSPEGRYVIVEVEK
jgi:hypothetical protein